MGDRLVVSIRHEGKFFAGAYLHWAASDEDVFDEILTKYLEEACFHDEGTVRTKALAVSCLQKAIDEYNSDAENCKAGVVTNWWISDADTKKLYESEESKKFLEENDFIKEGTNHNAYITVDEHIWWEWNNWAEGVLDNDYDDRTLTEMSKDFEENYKSLREWEKEFLYGKS